jgi:hypothetical protein
MYNLIRLALLGFVVFSLPIDVNAAAETKTPCVDEPNNMTLDIGIVTECSINPVGDQDLFRFSGVANTTVILSLVDLNGNNCGWYGVCPVADLYAPDGSLVKHLRSTESQTIALPASGTYLIRISDENDNQTANYRIGLERLWPASPDTKALVFERAISNESINPAPDQDFYAFNALQDSTITLTLSDLNGNNCGWYGVCPTVNLYGPDQKLVSSWRSQSTKDIKLSQSGTYTLHVFDESNNQEANYSLFLQCLFPPAGQTDCVGSSPAPMTCNGVTPTITGTLGDDYIKGTNGDDVIAGLEGNDRINGLSGNDVICGGSGDDVLQGGGGNDTLLGEGGANVLYGDSGNDSLKGGDSRDVLVGGAGDDALDAQGGDDVLIGGGGNDALQGGAGAGDICEKDANDATAPTGCETLKTGH